MSAGSGVRGEYAKSAQVRKRIVDAATEEFAESGFRAGTMKNIAERATISQRGLVHHFASKEELLLEVLEVRAAESAQLMLSSDPRDVLRSVVDVMVDNARRPGLVELHTVLFAEATSSEHPAHAHHAHRLQLWRDYLTSVFETLHREGALAPGLDPEVVATTLVAVQDGVQLQWLYHPEKIDMAGAVHDYLASIVPGWSRSSVV
ncbi:TetR/AcrR family transcriptional regulator [Agreia sp.]|uniref:TetR/AcrR family transcriptional regulator n=1 Tax=Agreia sp. TaxID=1872416 RepID=UPI0035BBF4CE